MWIVNQYLLKYYRWKNQHDYQERTKVEGDKLNIYSKE